MSLTGDALQLQNQVRRLMVSSVWLCMLIYAGGAVFGQAASDTVTNPATGAALLPQQKDIHHQNDTIPENIHNDTIPEAARQITRQLDSILPLSFEHDHMEGSGLSGRFFFHGSLWGIHRFDPVYHEGRIDRVGTGNLGDPMYELIPLLPREPGLRPGPEVYRYLLMDRHNRMIINTEEHLTGVSFVQGTNNAEIMLEANYAHTFSRHFNLNINYRRINHEGLYSFQKNRHTQLSLAGFKQFSDRYYLSFFSISNDIKTQNNGGIPADSVLFLPGAERRRTVPVNLTEGRTMAGYGQHGVRHFLSAENLPGVTWIAEQVFHNQRFHYYDNVPPDDGSFYGVFAVNPVGIRHFLHHRIVENSAGAMGSVGLFTGNLRLRHRWHIVDGDIQREHFQSVDVLGNATIHADSLLQWNWSAEAGLTGGEFTWAVNTRVRWMLFKSLHLYGSAQAMRYLPSLTDRQLIISFEELYRSDWSSVTGYDVSGGVHWLNAGLAAEVGFFQAFNFIHSGFDGLPVQTTLITIPRASVIFSHSLGPLHTDHRLSFQYGVDGVYPLPLWYSLHGIALEGMIFNRAMLARTGFDLRLSDSWESPLYMPVTGSFFPGTQVVETYPWLDFYFSFKVERFTAFAKFENVLDFFIEPAAYQIATYPLRDFSFRFGINWQFTD